MRYSGKRLWHNRPTLEWAEAPGGRSGPTKSTPGTVLSIENLSDVPLYAARPSRHVPPKRKAASWIAVAIVHLVIANFLIFSEGWKVIVRRGASTEVMLNLRGATDNSPIPEVQMTVPQAPTGVPPEVVIDPVIIPPKVQQQPNPLRQQGGITDGDLLGALGRDVACSAGHYENLTTAERGRCGRIPWRGTRLPDGAIVLRQPENRNRFAEPEPEIRISGADAQRRQMETGVNPGNCPLLLNVPCYTAVPQQRN